MLQSQRSRWLRTLICTLPLASGCADTGRWGGVSADRSSARTDLLAQLEDAEKKWIDAKSQVDRATTQVADLQSKLDSHVNAQTLLEQRADNLLRENQRLHEDLTAVVMNAGATADTVAVSAIQKVAGSAPIALELPDALKRSLAALGDHHPGVTFDARENVIRITSGDLFEKGDVPRPDGRKLLKELAELFNQPDAKRFNFLIVAHTAPGSTVPADLVILHPTVWHLAAHQSIAVQQLLEEGGLAATRVGIVSYAGQQPLVDGTDEGSRRINARVEIFFLPPDPPAK